ncbi:hypothetical protein Dimus_015870 [Dionaea muscipula]
MPFRFILSMGALTCNRKRVDEGFSANSSWSSISSSKYCHPVDSRVRKKQKVSSMRQSPEKMTSINSIVSRLSRYPEPKQQFKREVHAPCVLKFGSLFRRKRTSRELECRTGEVSQEGEPHDLGNIFSTKYEETKAIAYETIRFVKGHLAVEDKGKEKVVSEDSSIEEDRFVEDGREGVSVILDDGLQEENGMLLETAKKSGRVMVDCTASFSLVPDEAKVEHVETMLSSSFLNHGHYVNYPPLYKKLLVLAARRDPKLDSLQTEIKLNEKQRSSRLFLLSLKKPQPQEDSSGELFVPLTSEEEEEVARAFNSNNRKKVLVSHEGSNIQITGEVLQCLRPGAWLNDEVINLYLELLKEREKREPKRFLKCHFFNTFFYKKLIGGKNGYDYKSVRRWTTQKKLGYGLIECEKIFVPIHQQVHWCLAVINQKDKKFQYLDSLGGRDTRVLGVLEKYYVDEAKDKNEQDIDLSSWECEYVDGLPAQENGSDCGVFMIKYADFYSRGLSLRFSQDDMPYFRRRTVKEILKLKAD